MSTIAASIMKWAIADGATDPQIKYSDEDKTGQYGFTVYFGESQDLPNLSMGRRTLTALFEFSEAERVLVLSMSPTGFRICAPELLEAAAQELESINEGLHVGNIELTKDNGGLRFRAGVPVPDEGIPVEVIEAMVKSGTQAMEKHYDPIRTLCFGPSPVDSWRQMMAKREENKAILGAKQETPALADFAGTAPLVEWSAAVRRACTEGADRDAWRLIGPAIVIETEEPAEVSSLIYALSQECGMPCTEFEADAITQFQRHEDKPPMLYYLNGGDWQRHNDDKKYDADAHAGRQRVLRDGLQQFNPAYPAVFVTVVTSLKNLSPQLRAVGAFDRYFMVPSPSLNAIGEQFIKALGKARCAESITNAPGKVGKLLSWQFDTPDLRRLTVLRLRRLYEGVQRPLEFLDLVEATTQALLESERIQIESDALRHRVAFHEAGHVATAILDSNGRDMPEYSSIIPNSNYTGLMVDSVSYAYAQSDLHSYEDFRHEIRVLLGGRAAEEVAFGPTGISTGSSTDLENCNRHANRVFGIYGFAPAMEEENASASNLAVIRGDPTNTEYQHVELLTRSFLAKEYSIVVAMLRENQPLLEVVSARLKEKKVLDQQEMAAIWNEFRVVEDQQEPVLEAA